MSIRNTVRRTLQLQENLVTEEGELTRRGLFKKVGSEIVTSPIKKALAQQFVGGIAKHVAGEILKPSLAQVQPKPNVPTKHGYHRMGNITRTLSKHEWEWDGDYQIGTEGEPEISFTHKKYPDHMISVIDAGFHTDYDDDDEEKFSPSGEKEGVIWNHLRTSNGSFHCQAGNYIMNMDDDSPLSYGHNDQGSRSDLDKHLKAFHSDRSVPSLGNPGNPHKYD
jgi:hypothetical protein